MDRIFLQGLTAEATVGVFEWEQRVRQRLKLDMEIGVDIDKAAKSDDVQDTIDYKAVAKETKKFIEDSHYVLIETMAHDLADFLMQEFNIPYLRIRLSKLGAVRDSEAVGIIIERGKCD